MIIVKIWLRISRKVRSDQAALLLNLCVALIVANIIFLAGADKTSHQVNNPDKHYLQLSSLSELYVKFMLMKIKLFIFGRLHATPKCI